ncbi:hypothetical protein JW848_08635 [Candidatus Bipolaricaulota bacterium]|nr:hypothetical protein [Candidatus Bipolaricaulota bacterium]
MEAKTRANKDGSGSQVARSAVWIALITALLAVGGCAWFAPPTDDGDREGFRSATISRCRIVLQITAETNVSLLETSIGELPTIASAGSVFDVSEVFLIDTEAVGVVSTYVAAEHRLAATWDDGDHRETHVELVLDDSATVVSSLTVEQTVTEDAGIYRLTRRWEFEAHDLPYVGGDLEQGAWFRVDGEETCDALSAAIYRRQASASGYTAVEQMSSLICNDRSFLEVYLQP